MPLFRLPMPEWSQCEFCLKSILAILGQTRHWEPKIRAFLRTGYPIWVVTGSSPRILTLRKWTQPLLEEAEVGPGHAVFAVYTEIVEKGIYGAQWQRTDGSFTDLRPTKL